MSIEYPPTFNTSIFNNSAFNDEGTTLTLEDADKRYLQKIGGTISGSLTVNGGITGTLQTSSQPNITSTGNLTIPNSLTVTSGSTPFSVSNTASSSNYQIRIDSVSGNIDLRNNNSSNTTLLSLVSNGSRQLTCINNANLVNIPNHNGSTSGLQLGGTLVTATASELNYVDTTPGTAQASKALILDTNRDISNINTLSASSSLNVVRTTNGECFTADNGTVRSAIHCATNNCHIGTTSNHNFNIQSNSSNVLQCLATGDVSIVNNLNLTATKKINLGTAYIEADAINHLYFSTDFALDDCFRFHAEEYGKTIFYYGGVHTRFSTAFTSLYLDYNQNNTATPNGDITNNYWRLRSSGNWANIILSGSNGDFLQCKASDASVAIPKALNINKLPGSNISLFDAKGSSSYVDGGYNRFLRFEGAHATNPVIFELQVHGGDAATGSNAAYFGTVSNNQLRFGVNNSTRMTLDTNGYVGIATTSPSAPLHVNSTNASRSYGTGSQTVYSFELNGTTYSTTNRGLGPVTVSTSIIATQYVNAGGFVNVSDRRLKKDIENYEFKNLENLYNDNLKIKKYKWIKSDENDFSWIAQDLCNNGLSNLIKLTPNTELKATDEVLVDGLQLNIDYNKVVMYNVEMIKKLLNEIKNLKSGIKNMQDYIDSLEIEEI